jgi:hypothetical protein
MERICNISRNDQMRFCSSAFHVLSQEGYYFPSDRSKKVNTVQMYDDSQKCIQRVVMLTSYYRFRLRTLRCSINERKPWHVEFYALADLDAFQTVFILFPTTKGGKVVRLSTRIRKVGALLNPERIDENL